MLEFALRVKRSCGSPEDLTGRWRGSCVSPAFYWFHERPRQQVLLENAPSTGLVKGHVSEGGERCLRMPVGAIRDKDEGEIDFRGQNDEIGRAHV